MAFTMPSIPWSALALAPLSLGVAAGCSLGPGEEEVTIYRDDFGIPNIFAGTEEGVAFGAGYAQAEDRLEELLKQYRRAAGTMAEVFGPSHFEDDYRQRLWRHEAISRRGYGDLSRRARSLIEAFLGGIRLYMKRHPEKVPAWAQELEGWMVVALGRSIIWGWPEGDVHDDLERAGIRLDPIEPRASNQWAVAGSRTECGAPIAVIDPHLGWQGKFRFYEARLYGGSIEVAGCGILGSPLPGLGHNRHLSVAMTTGGPDVADAYEITLDPGRPGKYLHDGEWRDIEARREVIRVARDGVVEEVPIEIQHTHHGPIVAHRDGKAYAARLSYMDEVRLFDQMLEMMTARNLAGMRAALGKLQLMNQNIMVATVDGDIYYVRYGRVPIRPEGFDWSRPVPGSTSRTEWQGIHPLRDLVQVVNPPQGYMQNCNVSPRWITDGSPLQPERYAPRGYLHDEEHPHLHQRAAQTLAELRAEKRMTVERALEIAQSTVVHNADRWQAMLRAAGDPGLLDSDARKVRDLVLSWDRRLERDSTGAIAYLHWKEAVYAIPDELPAENAVSGERRLGKAARLLDQRGLEPPAVAGEKLLLALEAAARDLRKDWGEVEVPFGRKFLVGREESPRRFPVSGGSIPGASTPRALGFKALPDGRTRLAAGGQSAAQVVILTKPPTSFSLIPLGESDDPASPHFDDQAEKLMQWTRMKPTYFLKKDGPDGLLAHVKSVLVLHRPRR